MLFEYTHFFISNIFVSNARLKLAKNQANAKQHLEAELWLFENYSHSSSTLSSKNSRTYSKNKQKNKCVCIHMINHTENEDEKEKQITQIRYKYTLILTWIHI